MFKISRGISIIMILSILSGCQLIPPAKGLPSLAQFQYVQQHQQIQQQSQVDIQWQKQSFSFLLYQQQHADYLQVVALTVSGQVLFELHYDGQTVQVVQRIDALRKLPLDYILRDMLWGTLPANVIQSHLKNLGLILQQNNISALLQQRQILKANKIQLNVHVSQQEIQIENLNVPYTMVIRPVQQQFLQDQ